MERDSGERAAGRGLEVFSSLRAEGEDWLEQCFVTPVNFELMASARSVLIFGGDGAGKTALYCALVGRSHDQTGRPLRLVVDWRPEVSAVSHPSLGATESALRQINLIFKAAAEALARLLVQSRMDFQNAPEWSQEELVWFIRNYGGPEVRLRLDRIAHHDPAGFVAHLSQWLDATVVDSVSPSMATPRMPRLVAQRLVEALRATGIEGVWVISDGVEGWLPGINGADPLVDFLSALPLLCHLPNFVYKFILPSAMEKQLIQASGVSRGLVDGYQLRWDISQLITIVEQRLALASGEPGFRLSDLCNAKRLMTWLERTGGDSPREWLRQVSYLWTYYQARPHREPLTEKEWVAARRPPRVFIDETRQLVMVGGRRVGLNEFKGSGYEMLRLLYRESDRVVSKAELYFLAHEGRASIPRAPGDAGYLAPKEYEGIVDTDLWRLRQTIEPDLGASPVLIVAKRGQGVQLVNQL